jgi:MHS family alpha-ketoglutarate permease-like MFS transporter
MSAAPDTRQRLKSIFGGSAGNLVEWYDWYAYAAFSSYLAPHFFPKGDPLAQALNVWAIFAVGFFMRPIGAWADGHLRRPARAQGWPHAVGQR